MFLYFLLGIYQLSLFDVDNFRYYQSFATSIRSCKKYNIYLFCYIYLSNKYILHIKLAMPLNFYNFRIEVRFHYNLPPTMTSLVSPLATCFKRFCCSSSNWINLPLVIFPRSCSIVIAEDKPDARNV